MKALYIPKGKKQHYEELACQDIICDGVLRVDKGIQARRISGKGIVDAGSISARSVTAMEVEIASLVAGTLAVERICAAEIRVSGEAVVTCYLDTEYMEAKKLTAPAFQAGTLHVQEMTFLEKSGQSVLRVVVTDMLRRACAFVARFISERVPASLTEQAPQTPPEAAERTNEAKEAPPGQKEQAEDFEFLRLKAMYRYLKYQGQGYTLRIVPQDESPSPTTPAPSAVQAAYQKAA